MRCYGKIEELEKVEKERFVEIIQKRLLGEDVGDKIASHLIPQHPEGERRKKEIIAKTNEKLKGGSVYRFTPVHYANSAYERG